MSVSISNLSKNYGEQKVLNNIGFEIGEGEVVGFLGPNGAGKTTTMKIIAGTLSYNTGSVKVCGLEVKDNTLQTNALIGYLPEQNPLYTEMYVKEYYILLKTIPLMSVISLLLVPSVKRFSHGRLNVIFVLYFILFA